MGRPKKQAKELTTEEVVKQLFPGKAVKEAKKVAHEREATNGKSTKNKG